MLNYVVLGGYGEMGQFTVRDLFEHAERSVASSPIIWIVGRDVRKAAKFANSFHSNRVKWKAIDVSDINELAKFLKEKSICINSTQYYFNLHVMRACLKAHVPYVDLGGLFHMTKKQLKLHEKFKKAGLTAVLGCGATPGITNVMANYGASLLDRVSEIHVKFSGADFTKYKQPFVLPYSAETLFDEFSMKAAKLVKGKMKMVQPFSDEEYEIFSKPVGKSLCGSVLHSELATFPSSFKNRGLRECSFKGSFGDEFTQFFKLLIKLGFSKEPYRKWTVKFLDNFLPPTQRKAEVKDLEILRVTLIGLKNGKRKKIVVDCHAKSNPRWNAAAGTVDTAVPPSIIAQMVVKGFVKKAGVYPPEQIVPSLEFFKELRKRGILVKTSREEETENVPILTNSYVTIKP